MLKVLEKLIQTGPMTQWEWLDLGRTLFFKNVNQLYLIMIGWNPNFPPAETHRHHP